MFMYQSVPNSKKWLNIFIKSTISLYFYNNDTEKPFLIHMPQFFPSHQRLLLSYSKSYTPFCQFLQKSLSILNY